MENLNTLADAAPLDGTELIPVLQNGVWCKAPLYLLLSLPTPVIATAPTAFAAAVISDVEIDLTWTSAADNFVIERCRENDGAWVEVYNDVTNAFNDTSLYGEEHYYYRLKAQKAGEFDSDWVFIDDTTTAP